MENTEHKKEVQKREQGTDPCQQSQRSGYIVPEQHANAGHKLKRIQEQTVSVEVSHRVLHSVAHTAIQRRAWQSLASICTAMSAREDDLRQHYDEKFNAALSSFRQREQELQQQIKDLRPDVDIEEQEEGSDEDSGGHGWNAWARWTLYTCCKTAE